MTTYSRGLCAALLLLIFGLSLFACGKREWPTPIASEDKFRWRSAQAMRAQGCVILNLESSGAWQNIEALNVMLEPVGDGPGDGCLSCPFSPRTTRRFVQGSAGYRSEMNRIVLTVCDLDPKKTYRVQVVGFNIFPSLGTVLTDLMLAAPQ